MTGPTRWRRGVIWTAIAGLLCAGVVGGRSPGPAPVDGVLAACPSSPNCVSSDADPADATHAIAPLAPHGDAADRCARLFRVVSGVPGAGDGWIVGDTLRFEFHTRLFTDDVDLVCRPHEVDVRSASRIGYGDAGVNRARVEAIRAAWDATAR
ncbi:MAG: DUF1499 domain-containing protein [Myxococcota bacterium]